MTRPAATFADPREVRAHLIAAASAGVPVTYSELLEQLGYAFTRPKMRALCKVLAAIDEAGETAGEPELAVLVVRQSDGLPGQGWWVGYAHQHDYAGPWEGPEARRVIDRLQAETFRYWAARGT